MKKFKKLSRKEQELLDSWNAIKEKHCLPKLAGKYTVNVKELPKKTVSVPALLKPKVIPSKVSPGSSTALKEPKIYTGSKLIGIATMHKSNLVPIFSQEEAKDAAQMRRN